MSRRNGLWLDPDIATTDYNALQRALLAEADIDAVHLYAGRFLEDFPYVTDEFDDWRIAKAARVHTDVAAARIRAIRSLTSAERYADAAELAKAGLRLDILDESLATERVRCLALANDPLRAKQEFEVLRAAFESETGEVPSSIVALDDFLCNAQSAAAALAGPQTQFVGRRQERECTKQLVDDLQQQGAAVLITGEAGIGKSRLLSHLMRRLVMSGARVFAYSASAGEAQLPYSVIAGLLRDGFRSPDQHMLDPACIDGLSALLPDVIQRRALSSADRDELSKWDSIARYFNAVSSRTQVAICVDNLQWIDEASRALLTHLSGRLAGARVLFAFVARPRNTVPPIFEDAYNNVVRIHLSELPKSEAFELIASFCSSHDLHIGRDTAEFVYSKLGGRPFFILEALNVLKDMPQGSEAEWYQQLAASPALSESVIARLERTSVASRLLARAASIINRPVALHDLIAITDLPPAEAAEGAAELAAAGMIKHTGDIEFAHELIREAVQCSVPAFEATLWHSRIGKQLLRTSGGASAAAAHFEHAGETRLAYEYAKQAAAEARGARAFGLEEEQYQRMMRCSSGALHRDALYDLVRFWARTGQYLKIEPHLTALADQLASSPSTDVQLATEVALMELDERSRRSSPDALAERARHVIALAARGGSPVVATVVWHVAELFRRSRQYALMREISATLLREAPRIGVAGQVEATAAAALLTASCDGYMAAHDYSELAASLASKVADNLLVSRSRFVRGTVKLWSGDLIQARHDYEEAIATAERAGTHQILCAVRTNFSVVLAEQADFEGAVAMAQQSLKDGGYRNRAYAYGNLALIHLRRGDLSAVQHYAQSLRDCHSVSPEAWIPPHAAALLGLIALAQGDTEAAVAKAEYVSDHLSDAESVTDVSHLHVLRARAAVARGARDEALELLGHAIRRLEPFDYVASRRLMIEQAFQSSTTRDHEEALLKSISLEAEIKGAFLVAQEARTRLPM